MYWKRDTLHWENGSIKLHYSKITSCLERNHLKPCSVDILVKVNLLLRQLLCCINILWMKRPTSPQHSPKHSQTNCRVQHLYCHNPNPKPKVSQQSSRWKCSRRGLPAMWMRSREIDLICGGGGKNLFPLQCFSISHPWNIILPTNTQTHTCTVNLSQIL